MKRSINAYFAPLFDKEKIEKYQYQILRKLKRASHWPVCVFSKGHGLRVKQFTSLKASLRVLFKTLKTFLGMSSGWIQHSPS